MIYFFTIASPARSGTMWYSKLFTTETSFCYHELTQLIHPYPANLVTNNWLESQTTDHEFDQRQRRIFLQGYPDYFKRLWERNQYPEYKVYMVGNSDWMILPNLPGLWLLWPEMRFIFSARDGIRCVQSHFSHLGNFPPAHISMMKEKWQTTNSFELACRLWVSEVESWQHSKEWLARRKAQWIETRFEAVTTDLAEVRRLWDWIGIGQWEKYQDRNRSMLTTPVNARTNKTGVVLIDDIWAGWLPQQRVAFDRLCGPAMRRLGYTVPVL